MSGKALPFRRVTKNQRRLRRGQTSMGQRPDAVKDNERRKYRDPERDAVNHLAQLENHAHLPTVCVGMPHHRLLPLENVLRERKVPIGVDVQKGGSAT